MLHLLAFGGAKTDSTANEAAPGVVDQGWTMNAQNRYISPTKLSVVAATAMNDTLASARLNAPSLRNLGLPDIYPVTVSDIPAASPAIHYWGPNGPEIQPTEAFGIDTSNGASTIDRVHCGLWVRDRVEPIPAGKRFTLTGTAAITLLLDNWAAGTITFTQDLPYGQYAVIGMYAKCTACYLARLIFPGNTSWRPGCAAVPTVGQFDQRELFRSGTLGSWGTFISTQPPQLELIGSTAGAQTATVGLDLVAVNVPGSMG